MQLDHFFILTTRGAPIADRMLAMGMKEGTARDHPGQGTSNRRFNLVNSTIEWLYVRDTEEASIGPARQLNFPHRANGANASRLGLVVRTTQDTDEPPFNGWNYQPDYFTQGWTFRVGMNSGIETEPLCICMPLQLPERASEPADNPDWKLTQLQVSLPITEPSNVLRQFAKLPEVRVQTGGAHAIAIEMNHGRTGNSQVLEHDPPVTLTW